MLKEEIMKRRIIISLILLVLVFSTSAQAQDQDGGSFLKKMEQMLSQMTDEQKAFARANWLEPPVPYTRKHDHPFAYMVLPNPAPDTQTGVECSGCSSAYLLRFYGEKVNGVALYHQSTFPSKHEGGAYPKCFKILFEQQYKNYTTEYYTGTTEDLKDAISQGIPVIVLLFTGQSLHYVPVVGYDDYHFYIQDSVERYRNVPGHTAYNEAIDIVKFDAMWNIPIESCQRLFVVVHKNN